MKLEGVEPWMSTESYRGPDPRHFGETWKISVFRMAVSWQSNEILHEWWGKTYCQRVAIQQAARLRETELTLYQ